MNTVYLLAITFYMINPSTGDVRLSTYYDRMPSTTLEQCIERKQEHAKHTSSKVQAVECVKREVK